MVHGLLEITAAIRNQKFYRAIEVYSVTNVINEIGVSITFLWLHFFVGRSLKGRELFLDRINKNHLDLILSSHGRNYCTMEKLR